MLASANPASGPPEKLPLAPLKIRLMSLVYEAILLIAILFLASYLFLSIARDAQAGWLRSLFQGYLLTVCGMYFVFCWTRTGQTLPMKTWRMRVVTEEGSALNTGLALRRYLLAVPGMLCGVSLLWVFFD